MARLASGWGKWGRGSPPPDDPTPAIALAKSCREEDETSLERLLKEVAVDSVPSGVSWMRWSAKGRRHVQSNVYQGRSTRANMAWRTEN